MSEIADRVKKLISNNLSVSVAAVVPTAHLVKDLGADSLDNVELLLSLEDEFDVRLTDEQVVSIQTVGDAISLIEKVSA